ncbi:MAG: hypothetical protein ACFB9M_02695 [Myxococcota bacterium]
MDPVSVIVSAVVAGAAAALESTADNVIKDAYEGLKGLIKKKFSKVDVEQIETAPESPARKALLQEEVKQVAMAEDAEVVEAAKALLEKLNTSNQEALQKIGLDLQDFEAGGNLRVDRVSAPDVGVRAHKVKVEKDAVFSNVTVTGGPKKKDPQ